MNEEEKIIQRKGLISMFAMFLGLFCLINSILTVNLYKIDPAGTAELRSGYMTAVLTEPSLRDAETEIFLHGASCEVRTDSNETKRMADILEKCAEENALTLESISFYDKNGKHKGDFRRE